MIKSYDKHYIFKKNLDEIIAIPEESMLEQSKLSGIQMQIVSRTVSRNNNGDRFVGTGNGTHINAGAGKVIMGKEELRMRQEMNDNGQDNRGNPIDSGYH